MHFVYGKVLIVSEISESEIAHRVGDPTQDLLALPWKSARGPGHDLENV